MHTHKSPREHDCRSMITLINSNTHTARSGHKICKENREFVS